MTNNNERQTMNGAICAPETTHLVAITYDDAMKLYRENGRKPFSFVAAPYGILKTITIQSNNVVASPPDAARAHYEWLTANRRSRR
jgi:predicted alternative tryptophan synthase beta-subunit